MIRMARVPYTISIDSEVLERVRSAAFFEEETVSGFFETSVVERLAHLEAKNGEAYPVRKGKVKTGRPPNKEKEPKHNK